MDNATMDTSNPLLKRESAFSGAWAGSQPMTLQGTVNKAGILLLLTIGVLGLMLMLYASRTIRVTDKLVKGIFAATAAVAVVYLVDIVLNMFGLRVPLIHEGGWLGVGIS